MKELILKLTREEAELLKPILRNCHKMDRDDPDYAPANAAKNWRSMVIKLNKALRGN